MRNTNLRGDEYTYAAGAVSGRMRACMEFVNRLLGLDLEPIDLEFRHLVWRTVLVFFVAIVLARLGARRFLAHNAGFDIMVAVVLGSVLSRAISGQSPFFPTLGASVLLVALHHTLATMASHWHWLSVLVKGRPHVLVRDGEPDRAAMARAKITDDDLEANLRLHGNVADLRDVYEARLERNGSVSVVRARRDGVGGSPTEPLE
ncbi:MAG: YetF domain-containing protein, partial [Verrucomicrobiota bacterium]